MTTASEQPRPDDVRRIEEGAALLDRVTSSVQSVVVGQTILVRRLIQALLCGGHVLLEGVPGLAKSLACEALGQALALSNRRIQFTPDLLPADIVGTPIYRPDTGSFEVKKGPIFAHLILADEVNRAPAKVHSALLQAMQEKGVSIGGETFALEEPFCVLATQNPIEQEGTYSLPEAELDRFLFKVVVDYPTREEEAEIVLRMARTGAAKDAEQVVSREEILAARELVDAVHVAPRLIQYVLDVVRATRDLAGSGISDLAGSVRFGASPRASIALVLAARSAALLRGHPYAGPSDVKEVAHDVLRHRILLSYEAEADGRTVDEIIQAVLDRIEIP